MHLRISHEWVWPSLHGLHRHLSSSKLLLLLHGHLRLELLIHGLCHHILHHILVLHILVHLSSLLFCLVRKRVRYKLWLFWLLLSLSNSVHIRRLLFVLLTEGERVKIGWLLLLFRFYIVKCKDIYLLRHL